MPVSEAFRESFVEADGFRIRCMEAGDGPPLVHLHGAGGLRLSPAHDLLAKQFRVIAFEMPGFGASAENTRTQSMPGLAATMAAAAHQLGLDRMIPAEIGHLYKELIPNCHLVFVYDAGHAVDAERPEAFVEVVADFLERHEAFIISRTETVIHP